LHVYLTNIGVCMDQKQTRSEMVTWGALVDLAWNDPILVYDHDLLASSMYLNFSDITDHHYAGNL